MLKLRKIAITGGIASGKSTICRLLQKHQAYIVDTDTIVHQLLASDASVKEKITQLFGQEIETKGKIDREKLADKVFSDKQKLLQLESIIHPHVFQTIEKIYQKISPQGQYKYFVVEIPLLFETKKQKEFDFVICVNATDENIAKRKQMPVTQRAQRMLPLQEKIKLSDYVIENNGSIQELESQIIAIIQDIDSKQ